MADMREWGTVKENIYHESKYTSGRKKEAWRASSVSFCSYSLMSFFHRLLSIYLFTSHQSENPSVCVCVCVLKGKKTEKQTNEKDNSKSPFAPLQNKR